LLAVDLDSGQMPGAAAVETAAEFTGQRKRN
jgi:hypothetical protein